MLRPPESLRSHTIEVARTARYYTLGDLDGDVEEVWLVCHGYSQLAEKFIQYFSVLDDGRTVVIAPEALSLFYLNRFAAARGDARKVGATWMTRENRQAEIADYTRYLDTVCTEVLRSVERRTVRLSALGFSQGAATVSRWFATTTNAVDRLVLWAGSLPPDLDLAEAAARFRTTEFHLVVGKSDELISAEALLSEEKRLGHFGIPYKLTTFDGGHHMSQRVLKGLAVGPDQGR